MFDYQGTVLNTDGIMTTLSTKSIFFDKPHN